MMTLSRLDGAFPSVGGCDSRWLLERTGGDFTLRGQVAKLAERGVKVNQVQVWRFAHAEGLSFKKRSSRRTVETEGSLAAQAVKDAPGPA